MRIDLIAVGKLKEKWLKDGFDEYAKRIRRFADLRVIELVSAPDDLSPELAMDAEGKRILQKLPASGFKVAVDLHGRRFASEGFAKALDDWFVKGGSRIVFVIAGSNGFSPEVLAKMDTGVCLSELTFPHQLARILLAEQIFRAFKINKGETYHK